MKKIYRLVAFLLVITIWNISAQNNLPRLSPKAFVGQTVGYAKVVINYGSPGVKERSIWGELVPYGEVWRTGANEATTIEFDKELIIEGNKIPAGKYSLFTIPGKKEWTIILNSVFEQWGAYKYNKKDDVIRFTVEQEMNHHVERMNFNFEYKDAYRSDVILEWAKIKIAFEINSEIKNN